LICLSCHLAYVGQNGRNFSTRYEEQLHFFLTYNPESVFAQNLFHNGQSVGSVDSTMQLLNISNKVSYSDTLEKFFIFAETKKRNKVNDQHTFGPKGFFDVITQNTTSQSVLLQRTGESL
jgi:hypothetical protein